MSETTLPLSQIDGSSGNNLSLLTMVTATGLTVKEVKVPVTVKLLSASGVLFWTVVKLKDTLPVRAPAGMVTDWPVTLVKSVPASAVPLTRLSDTVVAADRTAAASGREAVTVTLVVDPSGTRDGFTARFTVVELARSSSVMVTAVPATAHKALLPNICTVSSGSAIALLLRVRVKEPEALISPAGIVIIRSSGAV